MKALVFTGARNPAQATRLELGSRTAGVTTCSGSATSLPRPLLKQLDHAANERGNVIRFAAGNKIAVADHFFIHPVSAGVLQVGLHRRPRGDRRPVASPASMIGPRPVADDRHRLVVLEEGLHELHRLGLHAQLVGILHASRQQQRVEVLRIRAVQLLIDRDLLAPSVWFQPLILPDLGETTFVSAPASLAPGEVSAVPPARRHRSQGLRLSFHSIACAMLYSYGCDPPLKGRLRDVIPFI